MRQPSPEDQLLFLQNLQRLLEEGTFVATYKYALILSIADICVEVGDDSGSELTIPTGEIAKKFVKYYWPHTVPYPTSSDIPEILRQNTGKPARVIQMLVRLRESTTHSLTQLQSNRAVWHALIRDVETTVRVMPLWKLQTIGSHSLEFLYENAGGGRTITLRPGVVFCMRRFYGLIGDLVKGAWIRYIRQHNQPVLGSRTDLSEFLFGSERNQLSVLSPFLGEIQERRCFYCSGRVKSSSGHVDHFIPWSRYPVDLGHNFVLAHGSCNSQKGDKIASVEHLNNWAKRNERFDSQLRSFFSAKRLPFDLATSMRVAHWAYSQMESVNGLTWLRRREMVPLKTGWEGVFKAMT